jgi:hypothetical protein
MALQERKNMIIIVTVSSSVRFILYFALFRILDKSGSEASKPTYLDPDPEPLRNTDFTINYYEKRAPV